MPAYHRRPDKESVTLVTGNSPARETKIICCLRPRSYIRREYMSGIYKFTAILLCILLAAGCTDYRRDIVSYVIYGVYTRECDSHCAAMYKLEKDHLLADTTDSFFKKKGKAMIFNDTLSKAEFERAKVVKSELPKILIHSRNKTFGHPDAHGQGGIFIRFKSGPVLKVFYIDTDLEKLPGELRPYAQLIMKTTGFRPL